MPWRLIDKEARRLYLASHVAEGVSPGSFVSCSFLKTCIL